jgi:hypothetical protein
MFVVSAARLVRAQFAFEAKRPQSNSCRATFIRSEVRPYLDIAALIGLHLSSNLKSICMSDSRRSPSALTSWPSRKSCKIWNRLAASCDSSHRLCLSGNLVFSQKKILHLYLLQHLQPRFPSLCIARDSSLRVSPLRS